MYSCTVSEIRYAGCDRSTVKIYLHRLLRHCTDFVVWSFKTLAGILWLCVLFVQVFRKDALEGRIRSLPVVGNNKSEGVCLLTGRSG